MKPAGSLPSGSIVTNKTETFQKQVLNAGFIEYGMSIEIDRI